MSQFRKCGRKRPPISGRLRQVDQPNSPDSTDQLTEALEEAGDDLLLREVAGEAVGGQDRAVVRLMRLAQRRRHARLVVQIRQTAIGILPANVQNPLRCRVPISHIRICDGSSPAIFSKNGSGREESHDSSPQTSTLHIFEYVTESTPDFGHSQTHTVTRRQSSRQSLRQRFPHPHTHIIFTVVA